MFRMVLAFLGYVTCMSEDAPPQISVVVPVCNEAGAAGPLAHEIAVALLGRRFEILFVDDASTDDTWQSLIDAAQEISQLRILHHAKNAGQSRAIRTGVLAAKGSVIVTLDGDGQNDPADALALIEAVLAGSSRLGLVGGERQRRQDTRAKRYASRLANAVRLRLLRDQAADTGCGLKAFRREAYLRLPYFDHMHRYLPALMLREGFDVAFLPVGHRPRLSGRSKYTNMGRLWASLWDLAGVIWLRGRSRDPGTVDEV